MQQEESMQLYGLTWQDMTEAGLAAWEKRLEEEREREAKGALFGLGYCMPWAKRQRCAEIK